MKLKELKDSLNKRFTSDFDNTEVLLNFNANGKTDYDCLAFIGMTPDMKAIILGSHLEALRLIKEGKIKSNKNDGKE